MKIYSRVFMSDKHTKMYIIHTHPSGIIIIMVVVIGRVMEDDEEES